MKRAALVVIEDASDRGAVVQDDVTGRVLRDGRRIGLDGDFSAGRPRRRCRHWPGSGVAPALQDRPLDTPQAADLATHLDLGVAVGLEDRLRQVAQEMVDAIAVRHAGEFPGDPRHEGVLLVRDPERDRLAQALRPSPGLGDQPSDFDGRRREQRLGEPDAFAGQLADDIEGLVPLLGLEAIDREDDLIGPVIVLAQGLGVLLACREHRLIAADVVGDAGLGEVDGEAVEQLAADLGDGPVAREAAMADPAEDVPADAPAGQGDGRLDLGAHGRGVARAAWVGAVVELADEMDGTVQGEEMAMAMVADIHQVAAAGAVAVEDVKLPFGEVRILGPVVRHVLTPVSIRMAFGVVLEAWKEDPRETP
jgi:hypothetical protein